jgi:hypothetical protein
MSHRKTSILPPVSFFEPDGRLPGFAQRRLDALITKKRTRRLSSDETKELEEMLEFIDRKTIEGLRKIRGSKQRSIKPKAQRRCHFSGTVSPSKNNL